MEKYRRINGQTQFSFQMKVFPVLTQRMEISVVVFYIETGSRYASYYSYANTKCKFALH